jgi:hypothetical protein
MFFNIGHQPLENYPCHWHMGSFCVSTDQGWTTTTVGTAQILYKGYADQAPLENLLEQILFQTEPKLTGNFCALVLVDDAIEIQTDRYRSFPMYVDNGVNNLVPKNQTVWTDSLVTVHSDLSVTETKFDAIGNIDVSPLTPDQVQQRIIEILDQKAQQLVANTSCPIKVFLSGGVDSLLVYSFLKKHTSNFELVLGSHVDWDYFWLKNSSDITKHWGYTQIHHWNQHCLLTSGAPGDEFMLRSPTTANQYLLSHGTSIPEQLQHYPDCLHREYFSQYTELFSTQRAGITEELCNTVINDWQHWHLGNTLTWTPFRDLELFKLFLSLPYKQALGQIMNSDVSRQLIERNAPGLTQALSDQKNSNNAMRNLRGLLNQQC